MHFQFLIIVTYFAHWILCKFFIAQPVCQAAVLYGHIYSPRNLVARKRCPWGLAGYFPAAGLRQHLSRLPLLNHLCHDCRAHFLLPSFHCRLHPKLYGLPQTTGSINSALAKLQTLFGNGPPKHPQIFTAVTPAHAPQNQVACIRIKSVLRCYVL